MATSDNVRIFISTVINKPHQVIRCVLSLSKSSMYELGHIDPTAKTQIRLREDV